VADIRSLADDAEAEACAEIMATSDPWMTLGRAYDRCLATMRDESLERYVAMSGREVVGFVLIAMRGTFSGYVKSLAVRSDYRGQGLGSELMSFAEQRIFRESPNVFICVSSFNPRARAFYDKLGYERVGELREFIVRGHDETLLRKTIGPLAEFNRR
jgi:ribosomal-protein-alanine N-acetyltransferase